jgi:hypothetical protein
MSRFITLLSQRHFAANAEHPRRGFRLAATCLVAGLAATAIAGAQQVAGKGEPKGDAAKAVSKERVKVVHPPVIEEEAKVPSFTLPDPLQAADGSTIASAEAWRTRRRPELLEQFRKLVYGRVPGRPEKLRFEAGPGRPFLGGKATARQIRVLFRGDPKGPAADLLLVLPANATSVPVFLGLNFNGNHSVHPDPSIPLNPNWMRPGADKGVLDNRATEKSRGVEASRWPLERIIARGYGVATCYYGDIDPDFDDGFANGVHPLFTPDPAARTDDAGGSIAAWAWGLSRLLDALETVPEVDAKRVAVIGHSRLGKTALWAGAEDERFAFVISNNSGCGGAALSRRAFGETVRRINHAFPHWFCRKYREFNDREHDCPIDQHELIALIAPRPVYVASASEDLWADPRGEYLSAFHASPVYRLFGDAGLPSAEPPALDTPVGEGRIGYHNRRGKHDVTAYDWDRYCDFADRVMKAR